MADGFMQNVWYMAGWAHELDKGMVARRIADLPVAIAKDRIGNAFALHDRCPHRFAPLSRGRLTDKGLD
jgi:phenylpropionate dioxygenase-like ring-hydroxylating dioxygenase large terminal subunit